MHDEVDSIDGRPCACEIVKHGFQAANFEQRRFHGLLTLKLRRRRSPTRLSDMISKTRAMPGKAAIQYSPESRNSKPLAIRRPSEGCVTGTPTPRKERVASKVIAPAILMVDTTSTEPME